MRYVILCLLLPAAAAGQDVQLPESVAAEPCAFVVLTAQAEGAVRWYVIDQGLTLLPREHTAGDKTLVVMARQPGVYRVLAYSAKGDIPGPPAVCRVVISGDGPGPQDPTPTTFAGRLATAYRADGSLMGASQLVKVWRDAAVLVEAKEIATTAELFAAIKSVEAQTLGAALPKTRQVVWDEIAAAYPENYILTTPFRESVQTKLTAVVTALEGL